VAHGSKYALVVGDKIYTLDTADKTALATLDQQAGKTATVTGTWTETPSKSVRSPRSEALVSQQSHFRMRSRLLK
jgi:hypothetical protein